MTFGIKIQAPSSFTAVPFMPLFKQNKRKSKQAFISTELSTHSGETWAGLSQREVLLHWCCHRNRAQCCEHVRILDLWARREATLPSVGLRPADSVNPAQTWLKPQGCWSEGHSDRSSAVVWRAVCDTTVFKSSKSAILSNSTAVHNVNSGLNVSLVQAETRLIKLNRFFFLILALIAHTYVKCSTVISA